VLLGNPEGVWAIRRKRTVFLHLSKVHYDRTCAEPARRTQRHSHGRLRRDRANHFAAPPERQKEMCVLVLREIHDLVEQVLDVNNIAPN
jgi:hypothetical protein